VFIVVPAYNEASTIRRVIRGLRQHGYRNIVVVDDGSEDDCGTQAREEGAIVLRHVINRGLGGALGTGLHAAAMLGAAIIVTFDGDGQHAPEDVRAVVGPIAAGEADLVIGSRIADRRGMPWYRQIANRVANLVTRVIFGVRSSDSQSGLRAFSRAAAQRIRISTNGMEVSSEILAEAARRGLRIAEVPIRAIYTEYSLSKGQSFKAGVRTAWKLLLAKAQR
jgi:glycosyltransferase involved in cell wall biosynthesis